MGNITNKGNLYETFDNWDIPIIVKNNSSFEVYYKNKKAVEQNIDNYLLCPLTHISINCDNYTIYTSKLVFEKNNLNTFTIAYDINNKTVIHNFISDNVIHYFKLKSMGSESVETLNSFLKLFTKTSFHNFNNSIITAIDERNTLFLWNGHLLILNRYNFFQINAEIEYNYDKNLATFYCNINNIQHIVDKNIEGIHKIENVDIVPKTTISSEIKTNTLAINIQKCVEKWLKQQNIVNYFISEDIPKYVIFDKEKLFIILNYFYWNIELFELHCNPYFIIFRFQTKNISSINHFCKNIVNYIHEMKGTIYYTNNMVEIRLPYKKDKLNRPETEIITKKEEIMEKIIVYLIDYDIDNRTKLTKYLRTKYVPVYDAAKITDLDFSNYTPNSVLIFNGKSEYNIDILREKGIIMPVIIADNLKKTENYYNYSLSYPFKNDDIYQVLIDIETKINIVYLDKTIKNSILVKNMLDRLNNYNIYLESRIEKLENIVNKLDIQLIILDSSVLSFYLSDFPSQLLKSFGIPILFVQKNNDLFSFSTYTEKIRKPFNLETLNTKIIKCFS